MTKAVKYLSLYLPVIVWATIIFSFSASPTIRVSQVYWREFAIKKTVHMLEYGSFATLIYRALRGSGMTKFDAGVYSVMFAATYGVGDEYHQSFTPGREPTVRDAIFDTIGAGLAVYILWNYLPLAPTKLRTLAKKLQLA